MKPKKRRQVNVRLNEAEYAELEMLRAALPLVRGEKPTAADAVRFAIKAALKPGRPRKEK